MKKNRALLLVGMAITASLAMAGCAGTDATRTTSDTGWVTSQYVDLPDGRKVICVMSDTKISCDWASAK